MSSHRTTERQLVEHFHRLQRRYAEALCALNLPNDRASEKDIRLERTMDQLRRAMEVATAEEQRQTQLRESWTALNLSPGPELRQAVASCQQVMEELLRHVRQYESTLTGRRSRLAPEFDKVAVHQSCEHAYRRGAN